MDQPQYADQRSLISNNLDHMQMIQLILEL